MPPSIRLQVRTGHQAPRQRERTDTIRSYMQCGPVRFSMSARTMTETTPFEHQVTPRHTEFRMAPELTEVTIQDIYAALVDDASRNEVIANDIARAIESARCPLLLTGRTE